MLYSLPFIAALIGWFTNWVAVKMLFYPKEEVNLGFMRLQGVFPRNQAQLAARIGKVVAEELLSSQDLKDRLAHPENVLTINQLVEAKVDHYLNVVFPSQYPITSAIMGTKRRDRFKGDVMVELEKAVPQVIDHYMDNIEERFNVEEIISQRVAALQPEKLEELIMNLLNKEFRFIELVGAILGFVIGWIQVLLVMV